MTEELRYADVVEGVRATLAAYVHALDDGRTDDVVATFTADAKVDLGDQGVHEGHDELRAAYAGFLPRRPQRHLVLNTHVVEWDEVDAHAISDVVFLLQGTEGWGVQVVGRYDDMFRNDAGTWRVRRRRLRFS